MLLDTQKIMESIKIGRKTYDIKKGDYIHYNGACYLFCAGDKRNLKWDGRYQRNNLMIPKSRLKKIPFDKMKKVEKGSKEQKNLIIRWYF